MVVTGVFLHTLITAMSSAVLKDAAWVAGVDLPRLLLHDGMEILARAGVVELKVSVRYFLFLFLFFGGGGLL